MQQLRVEYLQPPEPLEEQVDQRLLLRRALQAIGLLAVVALVAWLAPGLGEVRSELKDADGGWPRQYSTRVFAQRTSTTDNRQ